MYPLKFKPILKTVVWGGEKIAPYKEVVTDQHNIGESWELSGVKGHESVIAPGAGMIMLAMVLQAMNIPVDMIMIIYGVDRLFDMGRTCLNITGDISCALCVTKWESKKTAVK